MIWVAPEHISIPAKWPPPPDPSHGTRFVTGCRVYLLEYRSSMHNTYCKEKYFAACTKYTRKFQRYEKKTKSSKPVSELTTHPRPAPCKSPLRTPHDKTDYEVLPHISTFMRGSIQCQNQKKHFSATAHCISGWQFEHTKAKLGDTDLSQASLSELKGKLSPF